jgi:predicted ATP-dependent serine protease
VSRKPLPFACRACGVRYPKWMGRCADCGAWHSVEQDLERFGPRVVKLDAVREALHKRRPKG